MIKNFLRPLRLIVCVILIPALGIASDFAQLTNFNILEYVKLHAPKSYYIIGCGTLILYFILVIVEFARKKSGISSDIPASSSSQIIVTGNLKNSTINQIRDNQHE